VDELLWDWFIDMRRSFATTVSPKYVLMKARHFADVCLQQMEEQGAYIQMPILNAAWLHRWKNRHGVVWRRPNMKFKVGWETLKVRCAATWQNIQRVQQLAKRVLGKELPVEGIDEKPIHFNEAGSKNISTLSLPGEDVTLKQDHANTRERATVMTFTTSDKAKAACPSKLPVEIMKKAGSARTLKDINLPTDMSVSVTWAPKGSYRHDDILRYIRLWCEDWTEARAAANDYRIMLLDVARSHIGSDIVDELWARGYLCMYHYGCVTGVIQVNDTDNHAQFEREYLAFEERSFLRRQLDDPSDIGRDFTEVVNDVISTWKVINHEQCAQGYKTTGLAVALPEPGELIGPEDDCLGRAAKKVWDALAMPALRRDTLAQVNQALDDKEKSGELLTMALWRDLVQHPKNPPGPGVLPEGFEFEGELLPGEDPWIDAGDHVKLSQEEAQEKAIDASLDPDAVSVDFGEEMQAASLVLNAVDGEEPAVVEEAILAAREVAKCERLRAWAVSMRLPFAAREAQQKKISILKRKNPKATKGSLKSRLLLHRGIRAKIEAECAVADKRRDAARERKALQVKNKAIILESKVALRLSAEKRKEIAAELAKLPRKFNSTDCGQELKDGGNNKHQTNRQNLLERLKLRAPLLPPAVELLWPHIRNNFARQAALFHKEYVGCFIIKEVNAVINDLGKYFTHPDPAVKKSSKAGCPRAFEQFVERMRVQWPEKKDANETPLL
jgi:hypothetical protein